MQPTWTHFLVALPWFRNQFGLISVVGAGSLALSTSCFINISKINDGTVFLGQGSVLLSNVNTFGDVIPTHQADCVSIFSAQQSSCWSSTKCKGGCIPFSSRSCSLPGLQISASSSAVATPSSTQRPSQSPTKHTGSGNQEVASYEPITIQQGSFGKTGVFLANFVISLALVAGGGAAFYFMQKRDVVAI